MSSTAPQRPHMRLIHHSQEPNKRKNGKKVAYHLSRFLCRAAMCHLCKCASIQLLARKIWQRERKKHTCKINTNKKQKIIIIKTWKQKYRAFFYLIAGCRPVNIFCGIFVMKDVNRCKYILTQCSYSTWHNKRKGLSADGFDVFIFSSFMHCIPCA